MTYDHKKVALISGGSSGIGRALVVEFLNQGYQVVSVDKTPFEQKDQLKPTILKNLICEIADLSNASIITNLIQELIAKLKKVDVLINNAADDFRHGFTTISLEEWDRRIRNNLSHYFIMTQKVGEIMAKQGHGSIINISSICAYQSTSAYPAYSTSKSAIIGLTRAAAREFGEQNVRVNAIMPGWILTKKQQQLWVTPKSLTRQIELQCLKRSLEPNDLIGPCNFLSSDASAAITGQCLSVDGGATGTNP